MDPARVDEARLHALSHHPLKEPLKNFPAPPGPRLGQHALVRHFVGEVVTQKPAVIDPHRRHAQQFPLARHVVQKQKQHQFDDDHRVHRFVAIAPVKARDFRPHEIQAQHLVDPPQRRILRDQPTQVDRLRPHLVLSLVLSHHGNDPRASCAPLWIGFGQHAHVEAVARRDAVTEKSNRPACVGRFAAAPRERKSRVEDEKKQAHAVTGNVSPPAREVTLYLRRCAVKNPMHVFMRFADHLDVRSILQTEKCSRGFLRETLGHGVKHRFYEN